MNGLVQQLVGAASFMLSILAAACRRFAIRLGYALMCRPDCVVQRENALLAGVPNVVRICILRWQAYRSGYLLDLFGLLACMQLSCCRGLVMFVLLRGLAHRGLPDVCGHRLAARKCDEREAVAVVTDSSGLVRKYNTRCGSSLHSMRCEALAPDSPIGGAFAEIIDQVGSVKDACHYLVYGHHVADATPPSAAVLRVRQFSQRLVQSIFTKGDKTVISIRVLFSPPGFEAQQLHLDYGQYFKAVDTVFMAFTPSTSSNCTEVVEWARPEYADAAYSYVAQGVDGVDVHSLATYLHNTVEAHGEDSVPSYGHGEPQEYVRPPLARLIPIVADTGDIWSVRTSHNFHRRGPTFASDTMRITLNIDVVDVSETDGLGAFICEDTLAAGAGEICCHDQIDDFAGQDISVSGLDLSPLLDGRVCTSAIISS